MAESTSSEDCIVISESDEDTGESFITAARELRVSGNVGVPTLELNASSCATAPLHITHQGDNDCRLDVSSSSTPGWATTTINARGPIPVGGDSSQKAGGFGRVSPGRHIDSETSHSPTATAIGNHCETSEGNPSRNSEDVFTLGYATAHIADHSERRDINAASSNPGITLPTPFAAACTEQPFHTSTPARVGDSAYHPPPACSNRILDSHQMFLSHSPSTVNHPINISSSSSSFNSSMGSGSEGAGFNSSVSSTHMSDEADRDGLNGSHSCASAVASENTERTQVSNTAQPTTQSPLMNASSPVGSSQPARGDQASDPIDVELVQPRQYPEPLTAATGQATGDIVAMLSSQGAVVTVNAAILNHVVKLAAITLAVQHGINRQKYENDLHSLLRCNVCDYNRPQNASTLASSTSQSGSGPPQPQAESHREKSPSLALPGDGENIQNTNICGVTVSDPINETAHVDEGPVPLSESTPQQAADPEVFVIEKSTMTRTPRRRKIERPSTITCSTREEESCSSSHSVGSLTPEQLFDSTLTGSIQEESFGSESRTPLAHQDQHSLHELLQGSDISGPPRKKTRLTPSETSGAGHSGLHPSNASTGGSSHVPTSTLVSGGDTSTSLSGTHTCRCNIQLMYMCYSYKEWG